MGSNESKTICKTDLDLTSYKFKYTEYWGSYFSSFVVTFDKSNNKYISDVFNDKKCKYLPEVIFKIIKLKEFPHQTIAEVIGYSTINPYRENSFAIISKYNSSFSLYHLFERIRKGEIVENYNNTSRYIVLTGIASAMKHIYQINIGPLMLRPLSIYLDNDLHPKLIPEFNIISYYFDPTMSVPPSIKDTIYLPYDHKKYQNEKSDVYAFAFIAYEILTGLNPISFYPKNNRAHIAELLENGLRPEFNDSVSPAFKSLIQSCWSSNPIERPTFEMIFQNIAFNADKSSYPSDFDFDKFENYVNSIK